MTWSFLCFGKSGLVWFDEDSRNLGLFLRFTNFVIPRSLMTYIWPYAITVPDEVKSIWLTKLIPLKTYNTLQGQFSWIASLGKTRLFSTHIINDLSVFSLKLLFTRDSHWPAMFKNFKRQRIQECNNYLEVNSLALGKHLYFPPVSVLSWISSQVYYFIFHRNLSE